MTIDEFKKLIVGDRFKYYSQVWEIKEIQERGFVVTLWCPGHKNLHGSHKSLADFSDAWKYNKI